MFNVYNMLQAERITTEKRNLQCKLETVLKENSYLKNFAESLEIELTEALSHLQDKESEAADLSLELKEVRENLTQLQKEMEMQEIQVSVSAIGDAWNNCTCI